MRELGWKIFCDWARNIFTNQLQKLLVVWHQVWSARNAVWLEKKVPTSIEVGRNALQVVNSYCEESIAHVLMQSMMRSNVHWAPPPTNYYKINVDASLSVEHNAIGLGIIIRDSVGSFMATRAIRIDDCADPHRAKLLAAREGLIFAQDAGFCRVILEGDAQNVCKIIKGAKEDFSYNGSAIRDIVMFASWFSSF